MAVYRVTPAGAGDTDGSSWANAMGEAEFEISIEGGGDEAVAAGDIYYVQAGTYTLDSDYDSSVQDGTAILPISIIGVKAATTNETPTYADWPDVGSNDRPTFDTGATQTILLGDYYKIFNCIFTGSFADRIVQTGAYCVTYNVKCTNTTATAHKYAYYTGAYNQTIACEMVSTNGRGMLPGSGSLVAYSYFHDSGQAFITQNNLTVMHCVFHDMIYYVVNLSTSYNNSFINNTVYNCPAAFYGTTASSHVFINNIIDTVSGIAFEWTTQTDINFFWKNHKGNNVNDMWSLVAETMPHMDPEVTSGDPKFTTPGSNFSLQSDSPCIDAGLSLTFGVSE